MHINKGGGLQSIHSFYHTCENISVFRLYVCAHHEAGYRTLNKKTTEIQLLLYL